MSEPLELVEAWLDEIALHVAALRAGDDLLRGLIPIAESFPLSCGPGTPQPRERFMPKNPDLAWYEPDDWFPIGQLRVNPEPWISQLAFWIR